MIEYCQSLKCMEYFCDLGGDREYCAHCIYVAEYNVAMHVLYKLRSYC